MFTPVILGLSDGLLLLGASNLTARCWFGSLWIYSDSKLAPNEGFCKVGLQTEAGLTDVKWLTDRSIVTATDSGIPKHLINNKTIFTHQ